ncbi:putative transferase transcription regulator GNAT family [Helianthus annuus]|nr:putative transferase transcription regulator GNAT family [Helianthus annuus]
MVANGAVSVSLDSVRDKNLMQLKKLNSVLFPVRYNDKYYADALASHHFTKLGISIIIIQQIRHLYGSLFEFFYVIVCKYCWVLSYYSDICVGSIACRLEKKEDGAIRVYIMTLGVLAPYRGLGIGTKLLNHVIDLSSKENIGEIYLHVQTNNEDAINFYKKFGFEITETIKNYYARITPPDCYVVTKYVGQPQSEK